MRIQAQGIGCAFGEQVLFRSLSFSVNPGSPLSIKGSNGSGKSTLLAVLMGATPPLQGGVIWSENNHPLDPDSWFRMLSYSSPFLELPGHLTIRELIDWYFSFKPEPVDAALQLLLRRESDSFPQKRPVERFSTGMKQRLKNLLAITANVPVLFLDEPCSNLDDENIARYQSWVSLISSSKTIVVATNNPGAEAPFCKAEICLGA